MTESVGIVEPSPRDARLARRLSGVVIVVTFTVLVGWYAGVEQLTTVIPGFASMKPNTALCLFLLATFPWFATRGRPPLLSGATLVVAGVTAVELALRVHWWVDELLPGIDLRGNDPQMAPITAFCLLMLACSDLAARRGGRRAPQAMAVMAMFAAYVALIGYIYGASNLYGVGAYSSIALPTAVSITLLGASRLAVAPGGMPMGLLRDPGPGGSMVRSLGPFMIFGPPALGYLRLVGQRLGWYDTQFGVAILVTVLTVASLALLFRTARHVRVSDHARAQASADLAELNVDLERRVLEQTAQVQFLAFHDSLTKLPNRAVLMDRLQQALHQASRTGRGVGLLFLDLNRFKSINDDLGHDAGDQVLCEVARRLEAAARSGDTVARLGGDEYVMVCPNVESEPQLAGIADKVRVALEQPWAYEGIEVPIRASIGTTLGRAGDEPELLLREADHAMYRAKRSARAMP